MAKVSFRSKSSRLASSNGVLDVFRKAFHGFLCLAALILGFRLSGEAVLFLGSSTKSAFFNGSSSSGLHLENIDVTLKFPYITEAKEVSSLPRVKFQSSVDLALHGVNRSGSTERQANQQLSPPQRKSSRVHVGRHEILIRSQPHPDPLQSLKAHSLIKVVQSHQIPLSGTSGHKQLLVITPTFARTFQALHLTGLVHTLQIVPFPLIWIVVEAGGVSEETAALLSRSRLFFYHIGLADAMPLAVDQRHQMEMRLRIEGLRVIREKQLDGIVLFMDDSNTYSFEFFKEAQKTKWISGFSIGLLSDFNLLKDGGETSVTKNSKGFSSMQPTLEIQGPSCDLHGRIAGWLALSEAGGRFATRNQRALEWAGFSLNSKLLWEGYQGHAGFRSWNEVLKHTANLIKSPLDFVENFTLVEPLGDCGRNILLWRLQVEARADSKFPSRWKIQPGLEVVVPSKRTPWPEISQKREVSKLLSFVPTERYRLNQSNKIGRKRKVPV